MSNGIPDMTPLFFDPIEYRVMMMTKEQQDAQLRAMVKPEHWEKFGLSVELGEE